MLLKTDAKHNLILYKIYDDCRQSNKN